MKTTLKSNQHCELYDSVNHLKVERILLFRYFLFFKRMFSCDEGSDKHCELHDSVDHQKIEIILLFRVVLEIMFFECHCLCVFWCVCWCVC